MARKSTTKTDTEAVLAEEPRSRSAKTAKAAAAKETKKVTRKTAEKSEKNTVDKEPAPRKTPARRSAKKAEANTEVYIQYWGKEVYAKDVVAAVKKIWTEEMGKEESDLKDLKVYIKPEDNGAHYVINDEVTGFIGL